MDAKTFSKKLKEIKAEVLALKQAHEYGLGRADFPWSGQEIIFSQGDTITIKVSFADTVENLPYMQFYSKASIQYFYLTLGSGTWANHTYTITQTAPVSSQSVIYVVATMPIKDFSIEVENV